MKTLCCGLLLLTSPLWARDYSWTDAHLHYVDFMQESEGMDAMFQAMDKAGVVQAWTFGMPVVKKWQAEAPRRPRYYLGDEAPLYYYSATDDILAQAILKLPDARRERLVPFISGFNPTDMNAARHIEALIERYPGLWRGIGEVLTRHDDLTALTEGETPRANHPALMKVYKLAACHRLPVLLHSNLTSLREETPIYLKELEEALQSNPETRFVLAHAGTSGGVEERQTPLDTLPEIVRALLDRYDNLYIDLSWSVREHYLLDDGTPQADWLTLIADHPHRFTLGTDLVGHFDSMEKIMAEYRPLLDALPETVARKLARDNARALPEGGATPGCAAG
ncbi:amidohydrolase family protein [Alloalcanivorax mobilis]|uniref:amidohydrolase family protein n=1 Tax=Alloalcanivorax mobilis TaxID=2019569 RepID=UPI000B5B1C2B|nr:amidohydrolase family protein [Alloalcanivorax mobilis]ASK34042.1 5-oxo-L-prolinase [Alcanivorax sp. N3-2A]|tara:strand:+ start:21356 stop:22366 length:1011 start_codon:yes stop_codon:yes gene_type:complete